MPDVVESRPVVPFRLIGVHPIRPFGLDKARTVVTEVVREDLAERVGREVLEAVSRPLAQAHLERVVVAAASRGRRRDVGDERRGGVERASLLKGRPRRGIAHALPGLVPFHGRHQMVRVVPHVTDVRRHG